MLLIEDVAIILAPSYRSRAYLQVLIAHGVGPSLAILLPGTEPEWNGVKDIMVDLFMDRRPTRFLPNKNLRLTLDEAGIEVIDYPVSDVNSDEFIDCVRNIKQNILIYSGPPGIILRPPIFRIGKRFLHAHGGEAPEYSGSTAFYFSILHENKIGATVFWMDEGLDTGDILVKNYCKPPSGINIDCILDPVLRAEAMATAIKGLINGQIQAMPQENDKRRVYYVIHPLLKHIALKKCGLLVGKLKNE